MKRFLSMILLACLVFCLTACNKVVAKTEHNNGDDMTTLLADKNTEYEIISVSDLNRDQDKFWVESNKKKHGYKLLGIYNEKSYKYLLITAGEMNTGGYSLEITEVVEDKDKVTFKVKLNKPAKDSMVTMALSYPYLLLKVSAVNKDIEVDFTNYKGGKGELNSLPKQLQIKKIQGLYNKRIDDNYISIKTVDDSFMFKYSKEREKNTLKLQDNMAVDIKYFKNSDGELEVCSIEQASLPGVPEEWEEFIGLGKFKGIQENNICVIEIEEADEIFWITVESIDGYKEGFKDEEIVVFNYYIDPYGRRVILSFEK